MGLNACWKGVCYNFINVYASRSFAKRKITWRESVIRKRINLGEDWCVGGDFNVVSLKEERISLGSVAKNSEIEAFSCFIEDMVLIDLPTIGSRFSWYNGGGTTMSRLDRFLLSEFLVRIWNISGQWIWKRDISDHCPIWMKCKNYDWGPKPFRFNNCWLKHINFAKTKWQKCAINGIGDFILSENLKSLKSSLRIWNKEMFGWIDLKVDGCVEDLNALDKLLVDNMGGNTGLLAYERH